MPFDTYSEILNDTTDGFKGESIQKLFDLIKETRNNGKHLFMLDNGGNTAATSHWVYDLGRGINRGDSKRPEIFSPADNGAIFSALGSDCGYRTTLVEQVENFLEPGDLVSVFSVSGSPSNLMETHRYTKEIGTKTACVAAGKGGKIIDMSDFTMIIPSENYGVVEDIHVILRHAVSRQIYADNVGVQGVLEDKDMYIAALDIGGIKTIVAMLDGNSGILIQESPPPTVERYETHLELYVQAMKRLMHQTELQTEDFVGLGVSPPGITDNERGILLYASYANQKSVKIADYLSKNLEISRVRRENDVNTCAIGEKRFGLGSNYTDSIWTTVSTSVGGVMVEGSKLVRGDLGSAGELGHLRTKYKSSAHCPCGQYGCLEAHGPGTALIRETRKRGLTSPVSVRALDEMGSKPDGAGCAVLARTGNTDALDISSQIGTYLGRNISYCINILNTQAVAIGGGAATSLDLLLPPIRVSVQQNTSKQMQDIDTVETPLGYEAALLGTTALTLEQ